MNKMNYIIGIFAIIVIGSMAVKKKNDADDLERFKSTSEGHSVLWDEYNKCKKTPYAVPVECKLSAIEYVSAKGYEDDPVLLLNDLDNYLSSHK